MELTKATLANLSELQKICKGAYSLNFHDHWTGNGLDLYLEREFGTQRLTADLNDHLTDYCFLMENNQPAGFIKMRYQSNLPGLPAAEGTELEKIYVLPIHKGRGIGKYAIQQVIQKARDYGSKILFLCVLDTNTSAIAIYEKAGFQYHSKIHLEHLFLKDELRGMNRMYMEL